MSTFRDYQRKLRKENLHVVRTKKERKPIQIDNASVEEFLKGKVPFALNCKFIKETKMFTKEKKLVKQKTFCIKKSKKTSAFLQAINDKIQNKFKPFWEFNEKWFLKCMDNNEQKLTKNKWCKMKFYYNYKGNCLFLVKDIEKY